MQRMTWSRLTAFRRPAAEVEGAARYRPDPPPSREIGGDRVVHEQDIAHLPAVAVNGDRFARQRPKQEMRDPALVLRAALPPSVDAAHAQHRCREARNCARSRARIGPRRPWSSRTGVWKLIGAVFADAVRAQAAHRAADSARRRPRARRPPDRHRPCSCWRKRCGTGVGRRRSASSSSIVPRTLTSKSSRGSSRLVVTATWAAMWNTALRTRRRLLDRRFVADVGDDRGNQPGMAPLQPSEVVPDARARERIVDQHVMAFGRQPIGQIAADEAGAAGHEDGSRSRDTWRRQDVVHATNPRASSSRRASETRSTACCRSTQSASSPRLSAKPRRGTKPERLRASEISAKQWRMSPIRAFPSISGSICCRSIAAASWTRNLPDADILPAADIEHPAHGLGTLQRQHESAGHVLDMHEIAPLRAVFEDKRRFAIQQPRREDREHARIGIGKRLARSIDIEQSQGDGFHSICRRHRQREPFLHEFR